MHYINSNKDRGHREVSWETTAARNQWNTDGKKKDQPSNLDPMKIF